MADIKKMGMLGAGMMGAEIALCYALAGCEVVLFDINMEVLKKAQATKSKALDREIKKNRLAADQKETTLARIQATDKITNLASCDLVIEAVFEDAGVKEQVYRQLDKVLKQEAIIASNTSSIPISRLASFVGAARTQKFVGMHFFSPAMVMKLVEVIPGMLTSEETVQYAIDAVKLIQKTPIKVRDVAGFAVNRIYGAIMLEAMRIYEEGVASVEDLDTAVKLALGHPVGPFELMDITALDLNLSVQQILFEEYGERFRPLPIIKRKVDAGLVGRKAGEGFYKYN